MARIDKYDPHSGGFRAPLNADLPATSKTGAGNPLMVSINGSGRVVAGAASIDLVRGVVVTTEDKKAGDIVDVMTAGEVVEMANTAAGAVLTGLTTTGEIDDIAPDATHLRVGWCVEATRGVIRIGAATI
jgi:hypothetical protein